MINDRPILVLDFETTSAQAHPNKEGKTCGITQIAACVIHSRRLEIIGEFNRDNIKWHDDDDISDEAFKITKKDKNFIINHGIDPKQAWNEFVNFVWEHNPKRSSYNAPIAAGYNICGFDLPLLDKYCQKYGPIDTKNGRQSLVSNFMSMDMMQHIFWWTESNQNLPNIKLDTIREWMGLSKEGAHNALIDVQQTAQVIIKMIRLYRELGPRVKFERAFI